jgi:hypothetical protein
MAACGFGYPCGVAAAFAMVLYRSIVYLPYLSMYTHLNKELIACVLYIGAAKLEDLQRHKASLICAITFREGQS